jgi:hypothetical protein
MKSILRKSRITGPFDLTSLGRHAFCEGKSRAGDATGSGFPAETLRPRLQVNAMLYGLKKNANQKPKNIKKSAKSCEYLLNRFKS